MAQFGAEGPADRDREQGGQEGSTFRRTIFLIEQGIAGLVILLLVIGVLLVLWSIGVELWEAVFGGLRDYDLTHLLSQALLALMIAEIISSVGAFFERGQLDPVPLLIIGIIASIRRLLVISAEAANFLSARTDVPNSMLIELGILTVAIGVFAFAIRMVRTPRA